jgi:mannose-6-phosphate isomerase-like protein (cupin superfamily)
VSGSGARRDALPRIRGVADYTLRNLKEDVPDSAVEYGLSPALETRFARELLELRNSGVTYLRLAPDERVPFGHTHKEQEEVYVVVGGGGRIKLDDEIVELRRWDAIRIPPQTMRNLEGGAEGIEVLLFGAPNAGFGDAETEQGWWAEGREEPK